MPLEPDDCRVLGVLIEKAHTTPDQYPLTLNGLAAGCSQKSNRHPVESYDEARVYAAIDRLRAREMVVEVFMTGSRVAKFRHETREALGVDTPQLAVLAELMLRGPQTVGEIRGRASRIRPFESVEEVSAVLDSLVGHEPPLVQPVAPAPGSRAPRFGQLLCPDLHPEVGVVTETDAAAPTPAAGMRDVALADEVAALRGALIALAKATGHVEIVADLADPEVPDG